MYNVYGPKHYRDKELCWNSLKGDIDNGDNNNTIMGGYFNLILHANEKRGGYFNLDPSRDQLEVMMEDHELVDIVPKKRRYTWRKQKNWGRKYHGEA